MSEAEREWFLKDSTEDLEKMRAYYQGQITRLTEVRGLLSTIIRERHLDAAIKKQEIHITQVGEEELKIKTPKIAVTKMGDSP